MAAIGSPVRIIAIALSRPTRRGSRWVPPAPGIRPSLISGSPSRVPGAATRQWQPSATSRPPPSGVPCIAAMTGFSLASMTAITSMVVGPCAGLPNSPMSAPAMKVRPAQTITIAATAGIGARPRHRIDESGAQGVVQRVDGRIVDGDDGDIAVAAQADRLGHRVLPVELVSRPGN